MLDQYLPQTIKSSYHVLQVVCFSLWDMFHGYHLADTISATEPAKDKHYIRKELNFEVQDTNCIYIKYIRICCTGKFKFCKFMKMFSVHKVSVGLCFPWFCINAMCYAVCILMLLKIKILFQGDEIYDATLNQTNVGHNNNKFYLIQALGLFN